MDKPAVIKLAQPGYDVKTAGDENLIYNSNWPLPKIYKQGPVTIPDSTQNFTLTTHDLQYPAFFWFFSNASVDAYQGFGSIVNQRRSEFFGPTNSGTVGIDGGKLQFSAVGSMSGPLNLYYYIFALDLTKQYTAPIIKVGSVAGASDNNFVFKLAKDGKSVHSNNLDDFVIHSWARTPLIHSVNPSGGVTKSFIVNHNLGYTPMFFGYVKTNGLYTLLATGQGGSSSLQADEQTVTFTDTGGQELTIVVLKDPFVLDYSVRINI